MVVDVAQKKKIKKDAMEKYLAVKKAIDLWNPYGLLPMHQMMNSIVKAVWLLEKLKMAMT